MGNNYIARYLLVTQPEVIKVQLKGTDSLETSFNIRLHFIKIYAN
ncbi:hypothetical protein LV92_02628 [Arenibacter echinorum]|uniref:Uncharacterized protein n=1 Tax=Arenibacter echinorum TaxID=440515 RepID=A0A327R4F0_9FLAO|nr:hypothetical protein LV92_02628 [Arenibacter echinorum]